MLNIDGQGSDTIRQRLQDIETEGTPMGDVIALKREPCLDLTLCLPPQMVRQIREAARCHGWPVQFVAAGLLEAAKAELRTTLDVVGA